MSPETTHLLKDIPEDAAPTIWCSETSWGLATADTSRADCSACLVEEGLALWHFDF